MLSVRDSNGLTETASYPLYAATFASSRPGVLVVGGGGGAGRHGVKNKISVFDFTSRAPNVEPSAEIEASQDDSVQSLAGLGTKDGLIVYAGGCDHEDMAVAMHELR
jgi:prolactin regulatory element-binding protein